MGNWILRWQFDKATYQPGDWVRVNFWVENVGDTILFASEIGLQLEFQQEENLHYRRECAVQVAPRATQHASSLNFEIPKTIAGILRYRVTYHLWEYSFANEMWQDLGPFWEELKWYIKVLPVPYYKAFVSRGLRPEDRLVGDQIVEMVEEWGFETSTVGIDEVVDPRALAPAVRRRITDSDCLIAIATPRYIDALTNYWRTLEWLHGETGIAFGSSHPVFLLRDEAVVVGGLPGELRNLSVTYNPLDLEELRQRLGGVMPMFRQWVADKRKKEFVAGLARVGIPLLIGGITGFIIGRSRR